MRATTPCRRAHIHPLSLHPRAGPSTGPSKPASPSSASRPRPSSAALRPGPYPRTQRTGSPSRRPAGWLRCSRRARRAGRRACTRRRGASSSHTQRTSGCVVLPRRRRSLASAPLPLSPRSLLLAPGGRGLALGADSPFVPQARSAAREGHLAVVRALYQQSLASAQGAEAACPLRSAQEALLFEARPFLTPTKAECLPPRLACL